MMPMQPAEMARNRFDAAAEDKQRKAAVNYRKADAGGRCAECVHFDGTSACDLVAGRIAPDATCDLYEKVEEKPGQPEEAGEPPEGAMSGPPPF